MYNKDFIEKLCNLDYLKEDLLTIVNNINTKFDEYYICDVIIAAINKYINKEWDKNTLVEWSVIYSKILSKIYNLKSNELINNITDFICKCIVRELNKLSVCIGSEYDLIKITDYINQITIWEYLWKTKNEWQCVHTLSRMDYNRFFLFYNNSKKEFLTIIDESYKINCNREVFIYTRCEDEFYYLIKKLREKGYKKIVKYFNIT